jgi:hypothetical protein
MMILQTHKSARAVTHTSRMWTARIRLAARHVARSPQSLPLAAPQPSQIIATAESATTGRPNGLSCNDAIKRPCAACTVDRVAPHRGHGTFVCALNWHGRMKY